MSPNADDLNPQYCTRCHRHIPIAELRQYNGICYNCAEDAKNIKARQAHEAQQRAAESNRCINCGFLLLTDEIICPWCENPRKRNSHPTIWIDLDNLRPIELLIYKDMSQTQTAGAQIKKKTDVQLLEIISINSLDIETHPVFSMIMSCPDRNNHMTCDHSSHNTDGKIDRCLRQQAAKMTVRTIRHNLGFLERCVFWAQPRSTVIYTMWTCIERTKQACKKCRQREGIIKPPAKQRKIAVIHPGCNCSLTQLMSSNIYQAVNKTLDYLDAKAPLRASMVSTNLNRCGFHPRRSMSSKPNNASCCLIGLGIPVLLIILGLLFMKGGTP